LDEKICDAKSIQLIVICTYSYIRNDPGNEMFSYFNYANTKSHFVYGSQLEKSNLTQFAKGAINNTMSDFIYGLQSSNLNISQLGKLAIYSKGKLI
jgi:hypothetical protein